VSTVDRPRSPVYRQLEAYGESWKWDHDAAMACPDWEDNTAVGISIFHMLRGREESWREQVFRGTRDYSEEDNRDHRTRFAAWLETTERFLTTVLPQLETRFGKIEGADELRRFKDEAVKILSEWQPPRLSMAVGLRETTLSPEAAAEFNRIVYEQPPPPREESRHPPMREMSAEEFRRLFPKRGT
jgi:hypothetical protein